MLEFSGALLFFLQKLNETQRRKIEGLALAKMKKMDNDWNE
jgi:hypothetical protein